MKRNWKQLNVFFPTFPLNYFHLLLRKTAWLINRLNFCVNGDIKQRIVGNRRQLMRSSRNSFAFFIAGIERATTASLI